MDAYRALDNEYLTIDYHPDCELLKLVWKSTSADIKSEEEFKWLLGQVAEIYETFKPSYVLYDQRKFFFPLTPELQNWINENLVAILKRIGVKKMAFVLSHDLFSRISVEQTLEEAGKLNIKYFEDIDAAQKWVTK